MDAALTQFAMAAAAVALAVYIVKAVLPMLAKPASRQDGPDFTTQQRKAISEELQLSVLPILQQQTRILDELVTLQRHEAETHLRLQLAVEQVHDGQEKLRAGVHVTNDKLTGLIGRMKPASS